MTTGATAWALQTTHYFYHHRMDEPGKVTITAVSGGSVISTQTPPKFEGTLSCADGYRARRMGTLMLPATKRVERRVAPADLLPASYGGTLYTACRGGHGAVSLPMTRAVTCKRVKTVLYAPNYAMMLKMRHQWELSCENIPVVGEGYKPFKLFWNASRGDNFTTASSVGDSQAKAASYHYERVEGQLLKKPGPGRVPLKLYWSSSRQDNISVATAAGEAAAKGAGYKYVRTQGYIYSPTAPPPKGTAALELWWHAGRGDNVSVAHDETRKAVKDAKYARIRLQGYVHKVPRPEDLDANGRFKY